MRSASSAFWRASSRVLPWLIAPGTSSTRATIHPSSSGGSKAIVKSTEAAIENTVPAGVRHSAAARRSLTADRASASLNACAAPGASEITLRSANAASACSAAAPIANAERLWPRVWHPAAPGLPAEGLHSRMQTL